MKNPAQTLGKIIRHYKAKTARMWHQENLSIMWQRNYYDHIIRNEPDLNRIRQYIVNNPLTWQEDKYYEP